MSEKMLTRERCAAVLVVAITPRLPDLMQGLLAEEERLRKEG